LKFVRENLQFKGNVSIDVPTLSISFGPPTEGEISIWSITAFWEYSPRPIEPPIGPEPESPSDEERVKEHVLHIEKKSNSSDKSLMVSVESYDFVLSLQNQHGTELASSRSRLLYKYELGKKKSDEPPYSINQPISDTTKPWILTVTYDPSTPNPKVGEIVINGTVNFNGHRPVRVKKIPLDMLNMKLDRIFNDPQPIKMSIQNREFDEIRLPDSTEVTKIYHAFLSLELDRELFLGLTYEQDDKIEKDLHNLRLHGDWWGSVKLRIKVDLKPEEKIIPTLKVHAVSLEGYLALKISIVFDSTPMVTRVLFVYRNSTLNWEEDISLMELNMKDTKLTFYLVLKKGGWAIIPSSVESVLPESLNSKSEMGMYFLLGIGFNELSKMILTEFVPTFNSWIFGDKDSKLLGAKDEEVELYYDEGPATPRIIEDLLFYAPAPAPVIGISPHNVATITGIDSNIWEIGPGMEESSVFMVKRIEPLPTAADGTPLLSETPKDATAGYYPADGAGDIIIPDTNPVWEKHWTHLIVGKFTSSELSSLFFYSAHSGLGEIYGTDGKGGLYLLKRHEFLGHWSHIIPGNFGGDGLTDLLFYNSVTGKASFYLTEATGELRHLKTHTDWRRSWYSIIPGDFGGGEFSDLFFYDAASAYCEFCTTDGTGNLILLKTFANLHSGWTQIIPIKFYSDKGTSLIFYDASSGRAEARQLESIKKLDGSREFLFNLIKVYAPWDRDWTKIVPFRFSVSHPYSGLLFYSSSRGYGESYSCDTKGNLIPFRKHTDWKRNWRWILPGNFGGIKIESSSMVIPEAHIANLNERIDHIVVLMLENRSFDHMLGFLSLHEGRTDIHGLTGHESNPSLDSGTAEKTVFPLADDTESVIPTDYPEQIDYPPTATRFLYDPGHDFDSIRIQRGDYLFMREARLSSLGLKIPEIYRIDPMKGFILAHKIRLMSKYSLLDKNQIDRMSGDIMGYYTSQHVPVYKFLADEYLICDHWHAAVPGHTWQNRYSEITGFLAPDETGRPSPNNPDMETFEPLKIPTIFDHLSDRGRTWKYYEHDFCMLRTFSKYTFDNTNILPIEKFFEDAAAGTLPDVTYIEPDLVDISDDKHPANDDHPPSDIRRGQDLVSRIHNALRNSPKWNRTLFIITYDEHGGFYDHVFPKDDPNLPALFSRKYEPTISSLSPYGSHVFEKPIRYLGMRVPTFVVSPQVKPKCAEHTVYDHTSILKTIIARFLWPNPPYMGLRVSQAQDLGPLLTESPRQDIPQAPDVSLSEVSSKDWTIGVPKQIDRSDDFHYILRGIRDRLIGASR